MVQSSTVDFIFLFFLQATLSPPSKPASEVVEAVSKTAREYRDRLPDFLCNEKITSATFDSGKLREQKIVESIFTPSQKVGAQREIVAIDGKPAPKNAKMPGLPIRWDATFGWLLEAAFSPGILQYHDYVLDQQSNPAGMLILEYKTRTGQKGMDWPIYGETRVARDAGTAWIDTASMQVVRIERNFLNLPSAASRLFATTDFGPVNIGGKQYWVPNTLRIESAERDPRKTALFVAEYSGCKKFGADVKVLP
jgi:hypothetical protein